MLNITAPIDIYNKSTEKRMRKKQVQTTDIGQLRSGEYTSFTFDIQNTSNDPISYKTIYTRINGGEQAALCAATIYPGSTLGFHIYW